MRQQGYHYLLGVKGNQPVLLHEARLWLGKRTDADAISEDMERGHTVTRTVYLGQASTGPEG